MKFTLSMLIVLLFALCTFGQNERDKGVELYLQGNYDGAIEVLQKVVQTDEKDRDGWLYLGMSFAKIKKTRKHSKPYAKEIQFQKKILPTMTKN